MDRAKRAALGILAGLLKAANEALRVAVQFCETSNGAVTREQARTIAQAHEALVSVLMEVDLVSF